MITKRKHEIPVLMHSWKSSRTPKNLPTWQNWGEITGKTRVLYSELGKITDKTRVLPCGFAFLLKIIHLIILLKV